MQNALNPMNYVTSEGDSELKTKLLFGARKSPDK